LGLKPVDLVGVELEDVNFTQIGICMQKNNSVLNTCNQNLMFFSCLTLTLLRCIVDFEAQVLMRQVDFDVKFARSYVLEKGTHLLRKSSFCIRILNFFALRWVEKSNFKVKLFR